MLRLAGVVPLRIAARVAYYQLSHTLRHAHAEEDLDETAPLVAAALAAVAPIRRADGAVLTEREVRELFYRPPSQARLDGLVMRRTDLKAAIAKLKQARSR